MYSPRYILKMTAVCALATCPIHPYSLEQLKRLKQCNGVHQQDIQTEVPPECMTII